MNVLAGGGAGFALLALTACDSLRCGRGVAATQVVPTRPPSVETLEIGDVAFVRGLAETPFVLIKVRPGVTLPEKGRLEAVSASGDVARLEATSQHRGAYRVANILSGRPRQEDLVRLRYPRGDGNSSMGSPGEAASLEDILPLPGNESLATQNDRSRDDRDAIPSSAVDERVLSTADRDGGGAGGVEVDSGVERSVDGPLEALGEIQVDSPTPPATTDEVEPCAPSREIVPVDLPSLDPQPDEGDSFIQVAPGDR